MNPSAYEPSDLEKQRDAILKQFRAYLHLVISAHQTGQAKKLKSLDGPNLMTHCRELAGWPGHPLASELALPVMAMLQGIEQIAPKCEATLRRQDEQSKALHGSAQRILAQIDLAFSFILRNLNHQVASRGNLSTHSGFLSEILYADTHSGVRTARAIRRHYQASPKDLADADGGFAADYAWDVYQRVTELDRLADEFPKHVAKAARQMHAWPMLRHRHTNNPRRFSELAKRLELGAEYPTDASEGARFRPDTPMVLYLDPVIYRLHTFRIDDAVCRGGANMEDESPETETENDDIAWLWRQWPEDLPGEDLLQALRAARRLPPLTKATAKQWAEKAIVPLILATDARDYANCTEPVLRKIAGHKGVKSRATFKSRLLAAVTAALRGLARPV